MEKTAECGINNDKAVVGIDAFGGRTSCIAITLSLLPITELCHEWVLIWILTFNKLNKIPFIYALLFFCFYW